MIHGPTFTVICTRCGECERYKPVLRAVAILAKHPAALLILDDTYDRMVTEAITEAETALAEGGAS